MKKASNMNMLLILVVLFSTALNQSHEALDRGFVRLESSNQDLAESSIKNIEDQLAQKST